MTAERGQNISMVIPTRNRLHTLALTASSYCRQEAVDQIIFIDDMGDDDLQGFVATLAAAHPAIDFIMQRNPEHSGICGSRINGSRLARNEFILFCDDDEYLSDRYAATCRDKLIEYNAGVVSGRRIYMREGEDPAAAVARFGIGHRHRPAYDALLCELTPASCFAGDVKSPLTTSIMLTRIGHIERFGFDRHYMSGNGYREETDFQLNLYTNGFDNVIVGQVHSIHLPPSAIRRPGAVGKLRSRRQNVYWSVKHTNYLYNKYWDRYAALNGVKMPKSLALAWFSVFITYRNYLRPSILPLASRVVHLRNQIRPAAAAG